MEIETEKQSGRGEYAVGCAEGLVSKILKHLADYVANLWRSLERLIDTTK